LTRKPSSFATSQFGVRGNFVLIEEQRLRLGAGARAASGRSARPSAPDLPLVELPGAPPEDSDEDREKDERLGGKLDLLVIHDDREDESEYGDRVRDVD
jgi:hypothetical protein